MEILEQIDEIFENPKERELKDIDAFDFETYVNIDLAPFDKRVGRFSSSEAKRVLAWMVENSDVLELFISVDDEYNLLEDMLNDLSSNSDQKALTISVSGSDSLIEIAVDKEEDVLEWLHEYFGEKCSNDDEQEVCVLQKWYCEFNLKRDHWDALVGYESFEDDIANEILSSYCTAASDTAESCENTATDPFVPGNGSPDWWTDEVENIGDLNEPQDLEDLCDKHLVRR